MKCSKCQRQGHSARTCLGLPDGRLTDEALERTAMQEGVLEVYEARDCAQGALEWAK